jgi:DNA recombination protein RmuC
MQATILWLIVGIVAGAGAASLLAERRVRAEKDARFEDGKRVAELEATLTAERNASSEKVALLEETRERLAETFGALSDNALKQNNAAFLQLANENLQKFREQASGDFKLTRNEIDGLVKPVADTLQKLEQQVHGLEEKREGAYRALTQQVGQLAQAQDLLGKETHKLVTALRAPGTSGRWGEVQLRRVVELAGMVEYCDFEEQQSVSSDDGRLRPDMIVRLPNGRCIIVDAKAPTQAYFDAAQCADERERDLKLEQHAGKVKEHLTRLASKGYQSQFDGSPEFVVMFLPGESFFSAALESDRSLLEYGASKNVILATPTTLIALLKSVAYGWNQERLAENAKHIATLGADLYARLVKAMDYVGRIGKGLRTAVDAYNGAVGSMESRLLVQARRFKDLAAAEKPDIEALVPVDSQVRELQLEGTSQGELEDAEDRDSA